MGTSSRSRRRRRRTRSSAAAGDGRTGTPLLKRDEVAAAGLLTGFVLLLVGIALLTSSGTGEGGATTSPGGGATTGDVGATASPAVATASPVGATASPATATISPSNVTVTPGSATITPGGAPTAAASDEEAIQSLARRSIEVLPAGQWPSLYDSFSGEFQQRCSREQFEQVGEDSATQLGENLRLLRFKRTEGVTIEGQTAQAVIVGEIVGQGEYQVGAAFQKEDGVWKIAPVPNSEGCAAFNSLSG